MNKTDEIIDYIKSNYDLYSIQGIALELEEYVSDSTRREQTPLETLRAEFNKINKKVILERDKYRCVNCGSYKNLHVDHIIPLSQNGTNDLSNLQTLCQKCNLKKGKKNIKLPSWENTARGEQ